MHPSNPASTYRNSCDYVFDALRLTILAGRVAAGAALRQEDLARQLGTSRMPVREALLRLIGEGLVEAIPHRGVFVAALSMTEIEDIYDMRAVLEPLAVKLAVPHLDNVRRRSIRFALEEADDASQPATFGRNNTQLHMALHAACGRRRLLRTIETLLEASDRYQRVASRDPTNLAVITKEHHALVRAAMAGNAHTAATVMAKHIHNAGRRLIDYLRRQRQVPEPQLEQRRLL
ncbi:MAG: GntR family transcriptional regulator [Phycisphaerae bacterium]